jgi:putative MATE family efflux protein
VSDGRDPDRDPAAPDATSDGHPAGTGEAAPARDDGGRDPSALLGVWRRVFALSWPVGVEHTTRTLMRTTDVLVTGVFSPAAIAAVGLADLYARFPLRIGLGLGGGAIALSSQDTGAGADRNRDEAVTTALLFGLGAGVPFVVVGLLVAPELVALLGAPPAVARMGGTYLAVVFATAPARHVALVAARSLQGTGDTRTPMAVNVVANLANVVGSVGLGLGLYGVPRLGILGVGLATAAANVVSAGLFLAALRSSWTEAGFARPRDPVIARQLVALAVPKVGEGLAATLAEFPFNALLLGFGTEVNAAFQVGRRVYQQVTAPLSRGFNVAGNVVVGSALGAGDPARARFEGWATTLLGVLTVGTLGLALVAGARPLVALFTDDPSTVAFAAAFARVYGFSAPALVGFLVLSGALQGASETRVPFAARVTGTVGGLLGVTYVVGVALGDGPLGARLGIAVSYVWMAGVVVAAFRWNDWAGRAADMMADRGTTPGETGGDPDVGDD